MIFIAITMLGVISYKQLALELLPDAEYPQLAVQINSQSEVDPSYMEAQAVTSIEGAIKTIEGVEEINTVITTQRATIRVSFKKSANFKYASIKLQEKVKEIASSLPTGFTATVQKGANTGVSNSFMTLQVRGSGGVDRVRSLTDEKIVSELENIDGIASVNVYGGREKSIEVRIDKDACKAHNLTISRIASLLNQNAQERTYVGETNQYGKSYYVHTEASYKDPTDLENIVVASGPIFLKDVAEIFYDLKEEETYNRVNGKEAVAISLINESQRNIIDLSKKVENTINRLNENLAPYDIEIVEDSNTAKTMEDNLDQIAWLAVIGGLLAIVVLWIFLRNMRLVTIIALSIPISVYSAFNLFYAFGVTINSLTLVGMALAIGMLLDNSIVVLENIYRLSGRGLSPEKSVTQGTKEVWRSIFAATLTTITVFLPFVFSDNYLIKLIGYQIGVSIISTLGISLIVAFLFIPMATYVMLKAKKGSSNFYKKVSLGQRPVQIYIVLLKMSMRHAFAVFAIAVIVLFIILLLTMGNTDTNLKSAASDRFTVNVEMFQGSTLESTDKLVRILEERLEDIPEKKDLIVYVSEDQATLTIVLKEDYQKINNREIAEIKQDVNEKCRFENRSANITIGDSFSGGSSGSNDIMSGLSRMMNMMGIGNNSERIKIKGRDYQLMQLIGEDLNYFISQKDFINWSNVSSTGGRPEIHLTPDQILLNSYGITKNNITQGLSSLNAQTSSGSTFKVEDKEYEIIIKENTPEPVTEEEKLQQEQPKGMEDLKNTIISDNNGGIHSLDDIASLRKSTGMPQIRRVNGEKQLFLNYGFNSADEAPKELLESYRAEIEELIANYNLPAGIALEVQEKEDQFADFRFLMFAALLLIFMILASVFESVITPFVLLFTIPLAAIGSLFAIYITDNSLMNTNTLIGFLILLGVVVNNGIILIDYTNILRSRGYRRNIALLNAGLSRLRPILITSITTIIALLPMAFGKSEYSGLIGAPFAITVIGGLLCSCLLTLIIIPTVYLGLENTLNWYRSLPKRTKFIHLIIYLLGIYIINAKVDGMVYQILDFVILTIVIPGGTYLVQTSLRHAKSKLIKDDEPIEIRIENLVKVYEREGLFSREWNSGKLINEKNSDKSSWKNIFFNSIPYWLIPIFIFVIKDFSFKILFYCSLVSLCIFLIKKSSKYIYDNNIDIESIEGKHSKMKRLYYNIVTNIPVIGKKKKPFKALKGLNADIHNGMFGLLGPNGAGKSTLIRIISGVLDQSYGKIFINGYDTNIYREELQGLIGYLPQEFGTYEGMTSWEFLDYQAILKGITNSAVRKERLEYVLKAVHMYEKKDDKIGSFSGGMKQRIGIALILLHLPRILVVDEPTAGLDPRERIRFRNLLVELSKERIVIFSTHIIEDISSSCNQVVVINKGEVKYFGTPSEMHHFAKDMVWEFFVTSEEFETELDSQFVVFHIQEGDKIKVRYISETQPNPQAQRVEESLEDAYLCLLKNMSIKNK